MSKPVYRNKIIVKSDLDKINKIVSIFSIIKNGNLGYRHIRPRCVEVLSYYVLFGYSSDTRKLIIETGIGDKNLNQINSELQKNGYLVRDTRNMHNRHIAAELLLIKNYFLDEKIENKMFIIELIE